MTPGADKDSPEREYSPRCHPGTREWLTTDIQEWLMDEGRLSDLLWLYGTAGVGKSSVAQSIAEYAASCKCLGATYFFNRFTRNDYARFWVTVAYQLAVRIPGYHELVAAQISADPDILHKAPRVQFEQLIAEPLSTLPASPKFLVVIDGLDECKMGEDQLSIIQLISNIVYSNPSFPIVWMVCSRPEYHIEQRFSENKVTRCWKLELPVDSKEAKDDVVLFVRSSFQSIRDKYSDIVDESWPPEADLREIANAASGLFSVASTIARYVDDPEHSDPEARLQNVIRHLRKLDPGDRENPMAMLDHLYDHILSEIPLNILPTTLQIIHFTDKFMYLLSAMVLANFFGVSRGVLYRALRKLRSLLDVPSPQDALQKPIKFLHKSFNDYLSNPHRSGRFHRTEGDVTRDIINNFCRLASSTTLLSCDDVGIPPDFPLTWKPSNPADETSLRSELCWYCGAEVIYRIATHDSDNEDTLTAVRNLDYNFLVDMQRSADSGRTPAFNMEFCRWLVREVCFLR